MQLEEMLQKISKRGRWFIWAEDWEGGVKGVRRGMEWKGNWIRNSRNLLFGRRYILSIATVVEDYSTFSVQQSFITVIGDKKLRELVLTEEIFFIDLEPETLAD